MDTQDQIFRNQEASVSHTMINAPKTGNFHRKTKEYLRTEQSTRKKSKAIRARRRK